MPQVFTIKLNDGHDDPAVGLARHDSDPGIRVCRYRLRRCSAIHAVASSTRSPLG